jgi:hypothetical protein
MQSETNIAIGDKAPNEYFKDIRQQCENGKSYYGGITDLDQLRGNLVAHCIPNGMEKVGVENYDEFLRERRILMAAKIRDYYHAL